MRQVSIVGMPVSAEVAELADAQASGACGGNPVGVQIPPSAPCTTRFAWVHGGARGWASWKAIRVVHALNPSDADEPKFLLKGRRAWFRASMTRFAWHYHPSSAAEKRSNNSATCLRCW